MDTDFDVKRNDLFDTIEKREDLTPYDLRIEPGYVQANPCHFQLRHSP